MAATRGEEKEKKTGEILEGHKTLESGYITLEVLEKEGRIPPREILEKYPVPIIDCLEDIPCTPCHDVCPTNAIEMPTMIDRPRVRWEACTGCTLCAQACPGLAITIVWMNFGKKLRGRKDAENKALVAIPHEVLPVPKKGDIVRVYDRGHNYLCDGEVYSVIKSPRFGTTLVNVLLDKKCALAAKYIEVKSEP